MGEYAIDKRTGGKVKIGTCENMYYLRLEQINDVIPLAPENVDPKKDIEELYFRLPRKDEDGIEAGDFEYCGGYGAKPIRLYVPETITVDGEQKRNPLYDKHLDDLRAVAQKRKGRLQVRHECGIVVNIPCYHGATLPLPDGMFYNGHDPHRLAALAVGVRQGKPWVLVGCRTCGEGLWWFERGELAETFKPFADDAGEFSYLLEKLAEYEAVYHE